MVIIYCETIYKHQNLLLMRQGCGKKFDMGQFSESIQAHALPLNTKNKIKADKPLVDLLEKNS